MLFSHHFQYSIQIWIKSENLKIQDGGHLWRHLWTNQLEQLPVILNYRKWSIKRPGRLFNFHTKGGGGI